MKSAAALILLAGCAVIHPAEIRLTKATTPSLEFGPQPASPAASIIVSRDAYLMGTRVHLAVHVDDRESGLLTLESALAALEQTEDELSNWRRSSEISMLNREPLHHRRALAARLCLAFKDVWQWQRESGAAFDPAIGQLLEAWKVHGAGAIPSPATLAAALASSGIAQFDFDPRGCTISRRSDVILDTGAFGKGEALDRAAAVLGTAPWIIDLGGQVSVGGNTPRGDGWTILVAEPHRRDVPALRVRLTHGSLATSAGSERDLLVGGKRVGHIIDPRTGYPASFDGSVTVWHERGLVADILSTALYVMGPEPGLRWAEERRLAACYLIPEGSTLRVAATAAFHRLLSEQG